jgi:DNA-binding NarL/FixJ family response regulator
MDSINKGDTIMIDVMICEDHPIVAHALAKVINDDGDCRVVGTTSDKASSLATCAAGNVDVALLDVRLGLESGIDVAASIRKQHPSCKVVMLTAFPSDVSLVKAYELGASAFMLKQGVVGDLLKTIKEVNRDLQLIDRSTVAEAKRRLADSGADVLANVDDTDRKILTLLAQGRTNAEISDQVYLSLQTVRNRLSALLSKFHKRNRTELAVALNAMGDELV